MNYTEEEARKTYPELSELTTVFMEQEWTIDHQDAPGMLLIEIVARIFREHTDEWLADEKRSLAVQEEIKSVLAATTTTEETEGALGIRNDLDRFCGIDIRRVLSNLASVLATKGNVVY